ncbi:hypothetical protein REPUB_Repub12eG0035200 [Reevesia pubescens]
MEILAWNCRVAGRNEFLPELLTLINGYNPQVLTIMETRVNHSRAEAILVKIPYFGRLIATPHGQEGGIWFLWDKWLVNIQSHGFHPRAITPSIESFPLDCLVSASTLIFTLKYGIILKP